MIIMKKAIVGIAILKYCTIGFAQAYIDFNAFERGAALGRQQNMQDMLNAERYQRLMQQQQQIQQQQYQQQVEQMMRNATRHNVDAANVVRNGMSVDEVVRIFGDYPFNRQQFKMYEAMQWCRTNPPGRPDDYAVVYFYEGKVAKVVRGSQTADMDCRNKPAPLS